MGRTHRIPLDEFDAEGIAKAMQESTEPVLRRVRVRYEVAIPGLNASPAGSTTCLLEEGYTDESDLPLMIAIRLGIPADAVEITEVRNDV